ncbi:MAG TPA: glycosyltransferase family 87 protein [Ktedonobacterales bacterium]|nr:glycosyltransferase family 87 protein [Ktedonobacterales bacterium]
MPRALELALLAAVLLGTWALSEKRWLLPNGDIDEYRAYALAFWTGHPPLHALPAEYPPLAIVPFSLTLLPPLGQLDQFHLVFAAWMTAVVLAGYLGFLRLAGRRRAFIYFGYLLLGAAATIVARFDIVPALVTLAALWAAERGKFGYAYALVAAGILLKLYPAFLLPVVAIAHWQVAHAQDEDVGQRDVADGSRLTRWLRLPAAGRVGRGIALCAGLTFAGFAGAFVLNSAGTLSAFQYAGLRPLQVESTPASLMWLGSLAGISAVPNYSFTSLNLVGPLDEPLRLLSAVALVGGCLLAYRQQAHGRLTVGQAFVACLCVVLVTNKIFSPQYLIWVLPVVAYVEGFDWLWLAICFLTTLDYPFLYQMRHPIQTVTYSWQFLPEVALRNGLLLWATAHAIVRPTRNAARTLDAAAADTTRGGEAPEQEQRPGRTPEFAEYDV